MSQELMPSLTDHSEEQPFNSVAVVFKFFVAIEKYRDFYTPREVKLEVIDHTKAKEQDISPKIPFKAKFIAKFNPGRGAVKPWISVRIEIDGARATTYDFTNLRTDIWHPNNNLLGEKSHITFSGSIL